MLVAQKDAITKITGIITPEFIDTLENELGGAFTIVKSTHFVDGQRYGFLASMIPQEKYRVVISDPAWVYVAPANPGTYLTAALVAGVSMAQQEQLVAQHKEAQTTYTNYLGAQEAGKEFLLYGVGADALAPLRKQYIYLRRRDDSLDDTTPWREDSNKDEDVPKLLVQDRGLQDAMGSNHEHHGIFHWPRKVQELPSRSRHLDKRQRDDDGSRSKNVGKQDVH